MDLTSLAVALLLASTHMAADPGGALRQAAAQGDLSSMDALLAGGAAVDAADGRDWTPLHHAAIAGQAEAARRLLERGADPNARGQFDLTPLHWAAMKGRAEVCALLLRRGARADARDLWGMQPLHLAADVKVADVLLEAGASLTAVDDEGATPLHRARNGRVARAILQKKADIRLRDRAGRTPLELVVFDEKEVRDVVVYAARASARLREPTARVDLELINVSERPIKDFAVQVAETAAAGAEVRPARLPELAPGQRLAVETALTRRDGAAEGEYPLAWAFSAGGAPLGRVELRVDNSRGQTLEDQGYIRLGKGSLRPAPSAWQYLAYAAAPALVVGALVLLWRRGRGRSA